MMNIGLTDIDVLLLSVRDKESKRLITEAVTAYRGGAFRAAIMSTWIAVAYDIIAKARELTAQGATAAVKFTGELDRAISNNAIPLLQKMESNLLDIANKEMLLFSPHENIAFRRLYEDRHLCAHPAFVVDDDLYKPTPESVRTHIVNALNYLLVHAPLQGKSAISRIEADLLSASFPVAPSDIDVFLRSKYLDRAKDVLVENLIKWSFKALCGVDRLKFSSKVQQLVMILHTVSVAKARIYDEVTPGFLSTWIDGQDDEAILCIGHAIKFDVRIWGWLPNTSRIRINRLIDSCGVADLLSTGVLGLTAIPDLLEKINYRLPSMTQEEQVAVLTHAGFYAKPLIPFAIEKFGSAGGWRQAESLGEKFILPLAPIFDSDHIGMILDCAIKNNQIYSASGMASIFDRLFDGSPQAFPGAKHHWQKFLNCLAGLQLDGYYKYPGIKARLTASEESSEC